MTSHVAFIRLCVPHLGSMGCLSVFSHEQVALGSWHCIGQHGCLVCGVLDREVVTGVRRAGDGHDQSGLGSRSLPLPPLTLPTAPGYSWHMPFLLFCSIGAEHRALGRLGRVPVPSPSFCIPFWYGVSPSSLSWQLERWLSDHEYWLLLQSRRVWVPTPA